MDPTLPSPLPFYGPLTAFEPGSRKKSSREGGNLHLSDDRNFLRGLAADGVMTQQIKAESEAGLNFVQVRG